MGGKTKPLGLFRRGRIRSERGKTTYPAIIHYTPYEKRRKSHQIYAVLGQKKTQKKEAGVMKNRYISRHLERPPFKRNTIKGDYSKTGRDTEKNLGHKL